MRALATGLSIALLSATLAGCESKPVAAPENNVAEINEALAEPASAPENAMNMAMDNAGNAVGGNTTLHGNTDHGNTDH